MRYRNDGPITLYVVMDVDYGKVLHACTNMREARTVRLEYWRRDAREYKVLTYDQRGVK